MSSTFSHSCCEQRSRVKKGVISEEQDASLRLRRVSPRRIEVPSVVHDPDLLQQCHEVLIHVESEEEPASVRETEAEGLISGWEDRVQKGWTHDVSVKIFLTAARS